MNSVTFSWNIVQDLLVMGQYDFMRNAFAVGTVVAIVAGVVGYFVVVRRSSFAAHALAHVGFAGAAGALVVGVSPLLGLLVFTAGGGVAMATLGSHVQSRDKDIGTVLAFMLGLGVLFISLYKGYAAEAYALLFGQVLGISVSAAWLTLGIGAVVLLALAAMYRPLLFASLDEDVAAARGLPVVGLGVGFMLLLAAATSIAVQAVGVLLIFALMVTPATVATYLVRRPGRAVLLSVLIALVSTWLGLFLAFYIPYPVSFFITTIVFVWYVLARLCVRVFKMS